MRFLPTILLCLLTATPLFAQDRVRQQYPPDSNPQYFPAGLFSKSAEVSEWRARWYANELRGFGETSLFEDSGRDSTVYRFLLIPSFAPSLIIQLVVSRTGNGTLVSKLGMNSNGAAGISPREQTVLVSSEQVDKFLKLLHDADFWSLRTSKSDAVTFVDGQEWLLEAKQKDKYHVVDRSHGWMESGFARACDYLQELSHIKMELPVRDKEHSFPTSQHLTTTPD